MLFNLPLTENDKGMDIYLAKLVLTKGQQQRGSDEVDADVDADESCF